MTKEEHQILNNLVRLALTADSSTDFLEILNTFFKVDLEFTKAFREILGIMIYEVSSHIDAYVPSPNRTIYLEALIRNWASNNGSPFYGNVSKEFSAEIAKGKWLTEDAYR